MPKEYSPAPEIQTIAEKLIELFKPELEAFEIRYIFVSENPKKDGRECAALARKVVGLNAYLAGHAEGFFLVEFGKPAFDAFTERQLVAVVHHELCHFGISESGELSIIPHEIEEFSAVAEVHGAYTDGLTLFHHALQKGEADSANRDEIIARILGK